MRRDYGLDVEAEQSFKSARRRAFIERIVARLTCRPGGLLSFDQVRKRLGLWNARERGLHDIPLDKIVGSVQKCHDFTCSFLPRDRRLKERWKRVYIGMHGARGLPPIQVYQVGGVYFVEDGHHRVSVARQMGAETIGAYVKGFVGRAVPSMDAVYAAVT